MTGQKFVEYKFHNGSGDRGREGVLRKPKRGEFQRMKIRKEKKKKKRKEKKTKEKKKK